MLCTTQRYATLKSKQLRQRTAVWFLNMEAEPSEMEKLYYRFHVRVVNAVLQVFSLRLLSLTAKYIAVLNAVAMLALLVHLHVAFVRDVSSSGNCITRQIELELLLDAYRRNSSSTEVASPIAKPYLDVFDILQITIPGDKHGDTSMRTISNNSKILHSDREYFYSVQEGFLLLADDVKKKHFIQQNFVGYDTAILNACLSVHQYQGYLRTADDKYTIIPLGKLSRKRSFAWPVLQTAFIFIVSTIGVHHILRQSQKFINSVRIELQNEDQLTTPTRVIVRHCFRALLFVPIVLGLLLVMDFLFDDQLLSFMLFASVWLSELYVIIATRTVKTSTYFPRAFTLYFCCCNLYIFTFSTGFHYLALTSMVAFLQQAMLYLWVAYEVPAIQSGEINASTLRQYSDVNSETPTLAIDAWFPLLITVSPSSKLKCYPCTFQPRKGGCTTSPCGNISPPATSSVSRWKRRPTIHFPSSELFVQQSSDLEVQVKRRHSSHDCR